MRRLIRSFSSCLAEKCLAAGSVRLFWTDSVKTLPALRKILEDIDCELRKMRRAKRQQSLYVQPESGMREANEVKPTKDPHDEGAFSGADKIAERRWPNDRHVLGILRA